MRTILNKRTYDSIDEWEVLWTDGTKSWEKYERLEDEKVFIKYTEECKENRVIEHI